MKQILGRRRDESHGYSYSLSFQGLRLQFEFKAGRAADDAARWRAFSRRYRTEMKWPDKAHLLDLLAALSHATSLSVGCYCPSEERCHRSILRELLLERGAVIA